MINGCDSMRRRRKQRRSSILFGIIVSFISAIWFEIDSFQKFLHYPTPTRPITSSTSTRKNTASSTAVYAPFSHSSDSDRKNHSESANSMFQSWAPNNTFEKVLRSTKNVSPVDATNASVTYKVYCLDGYYGRTSNKIIQLANSLEIIHANNDSHPNARDNKEDTARNRVLSESKSTRTKTKSSTSVSHSKLALDYDWSKFYLSLFDERDDILLNYFDYLNDNDVLMKCDVLLSAKEVHYYHSFNKINPNLLALQPKLRIKIMAEKLFERRIMSTNGDGQGNTMSDINRSDGVSTVSTSVLNRNTMKRRIDKFARVISVHRRWLEGECHRRSSSSNEKFCMNESNRIGNTTMKQTHSTEQYCDIVYDNITQQFQHLEEDAPYQVILFTDGQKPEFDLTFPTIDDNHFTFQLWMMTLSGIHFGNPVSSVDYVVYHWRKGIRMYPSDCFPPIK